MKALIVLLITCICQSALAQNRNSVWVFGDSAGISFSNVTLPTPFGSKMDGRGSCSSIADSSGSIALYSFNTTGQTDHGTFVYNLIDTISNGNGLTGQSLYNMITIFPQSNYPNSYYIFHLGYLTTYGLYYSIVDIIRTLNFLYIFARLF